MVAAEVESWTPDAELQQLIEQGLSLEELPTPEPQLTVEEVFRTPHYPLHVDLPPNHPLDPTGRLSLLVAEWLMAHFIDRDELTVFRDGFGKWYVVRKEDEAHFDDAAEAIQGLDIFSLTHAPGFMPQT